MIDLKDYVRMIEEGQGVYDGCEELAKYIADIINSNPNEDFFVISGDDLTFKNIFFKNLLIYVERPTIEEDATYHIKTKDENKVLKLCKNTIKWNIKDKIFNFIELSIDYNSINHYDIAHELNHSYEDYKIKKKDSNKSILSYIGDLEAYGKAKQYYSIGSPMHQVVGYIEYVSTGTELRAFTTQALIKLRENLDKYNNFDDAIQWQSEHNEVFKKFIKMSTEFKNYLENESDRKILAKIYRNIHNTKKTATNKEKYYRLDTETKEFNTNQIIKKLENKYSEVYQALTKHINTILNDYAKKFDI